MDRNMPFHEIRTITRRPWLTRHRLQWSLNITRSIHRPCLHRASWKRLLRRWSSTAICKQHTQWSCTPSRLHRQVATIASSYHLGPAVMLLVTNYLVCLTHGLRSYHSWTALMCSWRHGHRIWHQQSQASCGHVWSCVPTNSRCILSGPPRFSLKGHSQLTVNT